MEEGSELLHRIGSGGALPMFTSFSPGWIRFAETFFPGILPHISSCKSPQQMFGAVAKSYGASILNVRPENMRVISVMPCTAKKYECARPEMTGASHYWKDKEGANASAPEYRDVDLVLTTRELARLMKMAGIDLIGHAGRGRGTPSLGVYTGAAPIIGRTRGRHGSALRTAITLLTGAPPAELRFDDLGTMDGIKRASLQVKDHTVRWRWRTGFPTRGRSANRSWSGGEFAGYHFSEIMTCPGGCIGGGGQPIPTNDATRAPAPAASTGTTGRYAPCDMSHENPEIQAHFREVP
jgi:iron only hydrogenase large subunit-like protein